MNYSILANRLVSKIALGPGFVLAGFTTPPLAPFEYDPSDQYAGDLSRSRIFPYIVRPTGQRADPINVVFAGSDDVRDVVKLTRETFGWDIEDGGRMFFSQRNGLKPQDAQLTSAEDAGLRFHIRLKAGFGLLADLPFVLGAVHTDYPVRCGHIGRDFDSDRDLLSFHFGERGFETFKTCWGNSAQVRHCNGELNNGDGIVAVIRLG